jgi:tetratricopeptide (TPR) repeat protein
MIPRETVRSSAGVFVLVIALAGCEDRSSPIESTPAAEVTPEPAAVDTFPATTETMPDAAPMTPPADPSAPPDPELAAITALIARQQFAEARLRAEAFLSQEPGSGRAYLLLALSHHKERNYGRARPFFERALELAPQEKVIHHFYGYCLYNLGDLDGARQQFTAHLESDPEEGDSHYGLGLVELEAGRLAEAERRFRGGIELTERLEQTDPALYRVRRTDLAKFHFRLADVHLARDELEAARDELLATIEIYPLHSNAHFKLSQVYQRLGEETLAAEALQRYEAVKEQVRPTGGKP